MDKKTMKLLKNKNTHIFFLDHIVKNIEKIKHFQLSISNVHTLFFLRYHSEPFFKRILSYYKKGVLNKSVRTVYQFP